MSRKINRTKMGKEARKLAQAKYRAANRDKRIAYFAAYYAKNKEVCLQKMEAYRRSKGQKLRGRQLTGDVDLPVVQIWKSQAEWTGIIEIGDNVYET